MERLQELVRACVAPRPDRLKELLEEDPTLSTAWDDQPRCARTGLMHAAHSGRVANVELLLKTARTAGVSIINERTSGGATALWYAASGGKAETVRVLLFHNAEPWLGQTTAESVSRTPLDMAREKGHSHVVAVIEAWFRNYWLYKARRICDDNRTMSLVADAPVPLHLQERVRLHGRDVMPKVLLRGVEVAEAGGQGGRAAAGAPSAAATGEGPRGTSNTSGGKKKRQRADYDAEHERLEVLTGAVEYVLGLSQEVYVEFMELLWGKRLEKGEKRRRRRLITS